MELARIVAPLLTVAIATSVGCTKQEATSPKEQATPAAPSGIRYEANVAAGGVEPAALDLKSPNTSGSDAATSGATLFASMNCDGCHGGGAPGWVGPSLIDGRWRYGGADEEIFSSIYYGRPKGMPAYGGVLGANGVWMLVAYLKAQPHPNVVPTTSWESGGNASPEPAAAASAPAAEPTSTAASAAPATPEQMLTKYGCVACHAVDKKVIGPALKDVAAKYRGQNVEEKLVAKVRNGGSGAWGDIPMSPNPQVPDAQLHTLVDWVLALK